MINSTTQCRGELRETYGSAPSSSIQTAANCGSRVCGCACRISLSKCSRPSWSVPGRSLAGKELIRRIWPDGTIVDFDRGLNAAVTRLRQALSDSADAPRYVETVARRGYRFLVPVEVIGDTPPPVDVRPSPLEAPRARPARLWAVVPVIAIAALGAWWFGRRVGSTAATRGRRLCSPAELERNGIRASLRTARRLSTSGSARESATCT